MRYPVTIAILTEQGGEIRAPVKESHADPDWRLLYPPQLMQGNVNGRGVPALLCVWTQDPPTN